MASDMADLLHISWPHLPDQCVGYLGRDHAGERKHPSSVPTHATMHPSSSSCSLRQCSTKSSSYKFRGAARRAQAKASISNSAFLQNGDECDFVSRFDG
uniref:Uncharacterized protein n=1 Tax=Oryza sativa subsp. japonica TaxID=39947 RepID=Q6K2J0_ORYSJ|nr:hypothetical protein [Oryza sativa Japonica Group]BAD73852.1 hypothetical protein [Oryza sativa Japonica Group]